MKYFSPEFHKFFTELAANNNRDWFTANRKRYEEYVKQPIHRFIGDLIGALAKEDKSIQITPSEAIFRINRDIRFSKDKTPYKLYASAAVNAGGKKNTTNAGIYLELGPEKFAMAGGVYQPDKEVLMMLRDKIAENPGKFMEAYTDRTFKKYWGEIRGEKNKVLAPEHREAAAITPFMFNKQFYYWTELDPEIIIGDKLLKTVIDHYNASASMRVFFDSALNR